MDISKIKTAKYINLEELLIMIQNDYATIELLLHEFTVTTAKDMQLLSSAIKESSYEQISAYSHKLKSTFKYLGMISAAELDVLKNLANEKGEINMIEETFLKIKKDFDGALNEAKQMIA